MGVSGNVWYSELSSEEGCDRQPLTYSKFMNSQDKNPGVFTPIQQKLPNTYLSRGKAKKRKCVPEHKGMLARSSHEDNEEEKGLRPSRSLNLQPPQQSWQGGDRPQAGGGSGSAHTRDGLLQTEPEQ